MITPDYLNEVMAETEAYVAEVNEYLLARIAKRIKGAFTNEQGNLIIPATQADLKMLMKSGMLYEDIEKEIAKRLPKLKKVIHKAFMQSAVEIAKQSNDFARQLADVEHINVDVPQIEVTGIPTTAEPLLMTPAEIRCLEDVYKRTNYSVTNMTKSTARLAQTTYTNACDMAYMKTQRGVPIGQAITEAIKEASEQGMRVVEYKTGKEDKIEVAIARAVRTGVNQANSEIVLKRCSELGMNYVKVSEHLGARVTKYEDYTNHAYWQGKVYKLDWSNPILKEFAITPEEEKEMDKHGFTWLNQIRTYMNSVR